MTRADAAAVPEALTADGYRRAQRQLMKADPVLAAVIRAVGDCALAERQRKDHLGALVGAIVSQQLSTKAAATILTRLLALFPDSTISGVEQIGAIGDDAFRAVGLSRQKVGYLRDLCACIGDGRLRLAELETLPDEEVIARLTTVKGFGRWTAEMFLMFRLHRPDVLPVGDLGIINAAQRLYGLRKRPDGARLQALGERWRPYRSVASWYLWQSLTLDPPPGGANPRSSPSKRRADSRALRR